ncbi:DUF4349 domain-containing protein [Goodfellowiella coeruleoviolacea]|uniref:DUF4349 domain-containing protein n=1 Tax=Goodfellowiella coeruleoviolacea TaxID=334858 RepID=A0AAE3GCY9_9PSEU|nr:DUF4349 domain-containing protein [Goodfellowiella coeruleoviolacea]MCP2166016.1 protein of unknown function (DUF4349) [Goodfellowiella coeruleoviolacea]
MRRTTLVALAALGVLGLVSGCSAGAGETASVAEQPVPGVATNSPGEGKADSQAGGDQNRAGTATPDTGQPGTAADPSAGRAVVRTAEVNLTSTDPAQVARRARDAVTAAGGHLAEEESAPAQVRLTLRVPPDRLDAVLDEFGRLGQVEWVRQTSQDVTGQVADLDGLISAQQASVDRVLALFQQAKTIGEITQVENELTRRQGELESLRRRRAGLADQVALSTVTLTISATSPAGEPAEESTGFVDALAGGWRALTAVLGGLLVGLGAVLPFLLVFGVPVAVVLWLVRHRRRRAAGRARAALAPAGTVDPAGTAAD